MLAAKKSSIVLLCLIGLLVAGVSFAFFRLIEQLPVEGTSLAIDWRILWQALHRTIPIYGNGSGLFISPWSLPFVWPIAQLPFRASWAALGFLTLIALLISVPRLSEQKKLWLVSVILLTTTYFSVRHLADGNFEGLILAGIVLALHGYTRHNPVILAVGLLMLTAKMQEVWVLVLVWAIYLLREWKFNELLKLAAAIGLVAVPMLVIFGRDWFGAMLAIQERGSIMDSSLVSTAGRLGIPAGITAITWAGIAILTLWMALKSTSSISREKAGCLICCSLLLAPYMAGNSYLTILAIGVVPLWQANRFAGGSLIAAVNSFYFLPQEVIYDWSATLITCLTVLTWGIFLYRLTIDEVRQSVSRTLIP